MLRLLERHYRGPLMPEDIAIAWKEIYYRQLEGALKLIGQPLPHFLICYQLFGYLVHENYRSLLEQIVKFAHHALGSRDIGCIPSRDHER